jgi:small subunit ribosomal protein S16
MIKLRLTRVGRKNEPKYRIVAIEEHRKRDGKYLDILGYWIPKKDKLEIDSKKVDLWIKKGAQPSDKVRDLLKL